MTIKIDPEFKALIDPLTPEEYGQLEKNIIEIGCKDSLVVWSGKSILVDGHNRFAICTKHNISYEVEEVDFSSRDDVIDWMINNQLGRRNLTPDQASYLRGLQYRREKKKQGTNNQHVKAKSEKGQNDPFHPEQTTAEKLAKQNGVSAATVKRDEKYSDAVDAVTEVAGTDARQTLKKLPRADQIRLGKVAKVAPETAKTAIELLDGTDNKQDAKDIVNQAAKEASRIEAPKPEPIKLTLTSPELEDRDEVIETEYGKIYVLHRPNLNPSLNRTNDSIDWAWWSWNPVTGCHHGCNYCYAREIANSPRMAAVYPYQFEPVYHPNRLQAPIKHKLPDDPDPRSRRIFTCSMADLFGKWVPQEWILSVFDTVKACPDWDFLFLTKFPQRLKEINDAMGGFPDNAWVGTTVDTRARVQLAEKAFQGIEAKVKWLSCEPMLEDLQFKSLSMFDLVVIGGQTASYFNKTPDFQPEWQWVEDLFFTARRDNCKIYWKENLTVRPKEQP